MRESPELWSSELKMKKKKGPNSSSVTNLYPTRMHWESYSLVHNFLGHNLSAKKKKKKHYLQLFPRKQKCKKCCKNLCLKSYRKFFTAEHGALKGNSSDTATALESGNPTASQRVTTSKVRLISFLKSFKFVSVVNNGVGQIQKLHNNFKEIKSMALTGTSGCGFYSEGLINVFVPLARLEWQPPLQAHSK